MTPETLAVETIITEATITEGLKALLPPTPEEIDISIEHYETAKRHHAAAKILLDEEKARLIFLVDSFGAVPAHAEQSKRLEGRLHTLTVTRGTSVAIDDSQVFDLGFYLSKIGRYELFAKLFTVVTKHKLVDGANDALRTIALPRQAHRKLRCDVRPVHPGRDQQPQRQGRAAQGRQAGEEGRPLMAILTFYVAECDKCQEKAPAIHGGMFTRANAWDIWKEYGWTRFRENMGLVYRCPDCSEAVQP